MKLSENTYVFQSWRLVLVRNDTMWSVCDQWLWWESWIWRGHKWHLLPGCTGDCWLLGGKTGVRGAIAEDNCKPGLLQGSLFIATWLRVSVRVQGPGAVFLSWFHFSLMCKNTVVVSDSCVGSGRAQGAGATPWSWLHFARWHSGGLHLCRVQRQGRELEQKPSGG